MVLFMRIYGTLAMVRQPKIDGYRSGRFSHRNDRGVFGFKLVGSQVSQGLVNSLPIVNRFGVFKHTQSSFVKVLERYMLGPFVFCCVILMPFQKASDFTVPLTSCLNRSRVWVSGKG